MDFSVTGANPDKLKNDEELKQWGRQLNAPLIQAGEWNQSTQFIYVILVSFIKTIDQAMLPYIIRCIDANTYHFQGQPNVDEITDLDKLILFCTTVIFNCTAQHSAINDSQYNMFSFQPNMPLHLSGNPPINKVHFTSS